MSILFAILGFGKSLFGAVLSWLSKRSLAEIGCIALALLAVIQFVALKSEKRHSHKVEAQLQKAVAELKRISTVRNEQKTTTRDNIAKAENGRKGAETVAKRIEAAPLPGNCRTSPEIMGADL